MRLVYTAVLFHRELPPELQIKIVCAGATRRWDGYITIWSISWTYPYHQNSSIFNPYATRVTRCHRILISLFKMAQLFSLWSWRLLGTLHPSIIRYNTASCLWGSSFRRIWRLWQYRHCHTRLSLFVVWKYVHMTAISWSGRILCWMILSDMTCSGRRYSWFTGTLVEWLGFCWI